MVTKGKIILICLLAIAFSLFVIKPVFAFDKNIVEDENTVIEQGQSVDNAVVFGSNAVVKGSVRGAVIVIDGDVTIEKTASVNNLVLVIGGDLNQEPGAKVTEEVLTFAFGNGANIGFLIGVLLILTSWVIRLALSLLFLLLSVAAGLIMKERLKPFTEPLLKSPGKLIAIGAITSILLTAISLLLIISIIGIPLAVVLSVLPFVFFFIGLAAISVMVGEKIVGQEERAAWLNLLYGSLIVIAAINFPFLGGLLVLGLIWLSTGLMVKWIYERFRSKR